MIELSLHILDLVQNAVEAGAGRVEILVEEDAKNDTLLLEVKDDGRGMGKEEIARVLDPFYSTRRTRHVGLGLPLLKEACQRCEGKIEIRSRPMEGTTVRALFQRSHMDRAPLGDVPAVLLTALFSSRPIDWCFVHRVDGREFRADTREMQRVLSDIPLTHPRTRKWLKEYLTEGEKGLVAVEG